jgi:ABC-type dipeptide/oligopeptide/nickel transport system ATPase component
VLISHDLAAIERICDRAILLNQGELVITGSPRHVIEEYSRTAYAAMSWSVSSSVAKLTRVCFSGPGGGPVRTGEPMSARCLLFKRTCGTRSSTFQFIGRAGIWHAVDVRRRPSSS